MAVAREQDVKNLAVFALDALTSIPAVPTAGVAYRDAAATEETFEAGQAYSSVYNSATYNQLFYLLSSVAKSMCEYGIMPFIAGQAYKQYARCIWTDGNVYRCSRDIAADESPYPTPKDESNVWSRDGGEGGRIAGEVVPFFNVSLGGTENRNPIFWGQSEPDTGWLICDGGSDGQGGTVPDLRNKFIQGASDTDDAGQTGGAASATPTVTVTGSSSQIAVQAATLSITQLAAHRHFTGVSCNTADRPAYAYYGSEQSPSSLNANGTNNNSDKFLALTQEIGSSQAHTHGITDSGHSHSATSSSIATVPPFYKLIYCVKLPAA